MSAASQKSTEITHFGSWTLNKLYQYCGNRNFTIVDFDSSYKASIYGPKEPRTAVARHIFDNVSTISCML